METKEKNGENIETHNKLRVAKKIFAVTNKQDPKVK
jgi:hypothetical protein